MEKVNLEKPLKRGKKVLKLCFKQVIPACSHKAV